MPGYERRESADGGMPLYQGPRQADVESERVRTPGKDDDARAQSPLPAVSVPKGGGAIRGIGEKFTANPVTGTGSLMVPIPTSPGRSGFGPELSLSYDSGAGNGPFGFGWSLSVPAIARKTDKGLPRYADAEESDVYVLAGAEDLVPVLAADGQRFEDTATEPGFTIHRYRPRVEGLFARIERWTERASGDIHWRSITRNNVTSMYGREDGSRVFDPDDRSRIFSWLICTSWDDRGNAIVYDYVPEDGAGVDGTLASERNRNRGAARYLKRIRYGNRVSRLVQPDLAQAEWLFEVVFDYEDGHYEDLPLDGARPEREQHRFALASIAGGSRWAVRPDPFSSYRAGFEVRTHRRCRRVLMFHRFAELGDEPCLVRATEVDYADLDLSKQVAVDDELAHQGSTRFASFIQSVTQSGFVRDATRPVVSRGGVNYVTYLKKSLPPLELDYSKAAIDDAVRDVTAGALDNLPVGLDAGTYHWVDLDGEGLSGILTDQAGGWFYKPNLGEGNLGPMRVLPARPSSALSGGGQQLLDLSGDGQLDVVAFDGPTPGFFERTASEGWETFRTFRQLPRIRWDEPNLRLIDLDGDGHADVLVTENEVFTWYPSLAEAGFGSAQRVRLPADEERGPRLVLADGTQSLYLADACGDGLTGLLRIRNGEVCYWPNLGYGRFGPKVTMDNAPWFDSPEQFDQRRVRLADIDGSGTTDIMYLGRDGARVYFNQAGNRWSDARRLDGFPPLDNVGSVTTADLLGNGTACLVWSSPLPRDARRPLRYLDLMSGTKPHLLTHARNNLGAETNIEYTASTRFYLADKAAGKPWVTRLPFPVHVVDRVETLDRIGRNRFVTRYAYHHGHFDGVEREFRGFGMVEQWDTEELGALKADGLLVAGDNFDAASHVPPVLTRTWFHTGVAFREHVSDYFAGLLDVSHTGEYYREPGLTDAQARDLLLDDTQLPEGLTVDEEREACRALKGSMLRQELYALDGSAKEPHPYAVTEQNFAVRCLQPRGDNRHAVFFTHPRESVAYHYERSLMPILNGAIVDEATADANPAVRRLPDPRISHALTLSVDDFGNVLLSSAVGYGRRFSDLRLPSQPDRDAQLRTLVTFTENRFTNALDGKDVYRTPLPYQGRTYELTGLPMPPGRTRFTCADLVEAADQAASIDYEQDSTPGALEKRLVEHVRTIYRSDDLAGPLPLGALESLALPYEGCKLAFTPGLVARVYGAKLTAAMLTDAGYVHGKEEAGIEDDRWWIPSARVFLSPGSADTPAQELAYAGAHFFMPRRSRDPFHTDALSTETFVAYDAYELLVEESRDPLGNRVTVGERDPNPDQPLTRRGHDYRVLHPALVMDPNRNRFTLAFDALGMVVSTAAMGKPEENPVPGDRIDPGLRPDLTQAEIDAFFANPKGPLAAALLGDASSRSVYDLTRNSRDPDKKQPAFAATLNRETHASEPVTAGGVRIQLELSYSDGFGREIQKKIEAEPGPVPQRDQLGNVILGADGQPLVTPNDVDPRWVGTGWTVFNNKGKAVRRYEPYFSDRHDFEFAVRVGLSPVLFYDAVTRVVGTLMPNHTWEKVVFDPWRQQAWSVSDTVLIADPKVDADVGDFFARLPDTDYLPTWYAQRQGGAAGPEEQAAAAKASMHADTPAQVHADALGRAFLTVAHNRFKTSDRPLAEPPTEEFSATRLRLDIEGNQREIVDAADRVIARYDYDMLSRRIHQASMDTGERWMLNDASSRPLYRWDDRQHRIRTGYDRLRRPTDSFLSENGGAERLVVQSIYGDSRPNPEQKNQRGKIVRILDQAGTATTEDYDFKGNLLRSERRLSTAYQGTLDWSLAVPLDPDIYSSVTRFDALNRPVEITAPDGSVVRLAYNEASLLETIAVNVRGEQAGGQLVWTPFVTNIDYDAMGRRIAIDFGNSVRTTYEYDRRTLRLAHLETRRDPAAFPDDCPDPPPAGWPGCRCQSLSYTYDPAGNITHIRDDAQEKIYFQNTRVEPSAEFTYDAINRLIEATGREHLGQVGGAPVPHSYNDAPRTRRHHPADGNAMGRYLERYFYDSVGNLLSMQHRGTGPANPGWTRDYVYDENSLLEPAHTSNRLTKTVVGAVQELYGNYDPHGNMGRMPQLQAVEWNHCDELAMTRRQAVSDDDTEGVQREGERTFYVYDAGGQRVRKVTELPDGSRKDERIYLGGFEIYRRAGANPLTRETLHVMDDKQRVALIETRTAGVEVGVPVRLIRYQHGNHLGSAVLELDDQAQIISYEEYTPYGSTSFSAARSQTEAPNRYRFIGRERDEESGLSHHGARYYIPWLGRWSSCDPLGVVDGPNLFAYARGNPVSFVDRRGTDSDSVILEEHDVVYGILTHPQPLAATRWWQQGPMAHRSEWAGDLSATEQKYISTFRSSPIPPALQMRKPVDPNHLTADESGQAKEWFGTGSEAGRQYANYENRRRIMAHYVYSHPTFVTAEVALFRLSRDVNPIQFALERGWQVGSGKEMFTGQEVSRLGAAAEFFVALALSYAMGKALKAVRPPIGVPGAGQTLAGLQDDVLSEAVEARASAISTKGSPAYLTNSQRGPVLTGVMDRTTGEVFFGMNEGVPADLHPLLRQRLAAYLNETGGATPAPAGTPGAHSEVNALNRALKAFEARMGRPATEADLGNFSYHNRALQGARKVEGVPPACPNCDALIQGTGAVR